MLGNLWDMKRMIDSYRKLQESLKNTIIRSKEDWVVIEITWEMKIRDVKIEDTSLLNPSSKDILEERIKKAFEKWQQKVQEIAMEKTKQILWFDPNDIANMFGWGGMWWMKLPWF